MNYLFVFLTSITLTFSSLTAQALPIYFEEQSDVFNHLTISSVEVLDLTNEYTDGSDDNISMAFDAKNLLPIIGTVNQAEFIVDKIINIGQKIWTVVEKGRPVSNYSSTKASALPGNATRWDQLNNWKAPRSKVIRLVYKNIYGIEVIRFTYRIVLLYGGGLNGVGKYIGYAGVEPVEITTAYMYTFNATAQIDSIFNMGSDKNPLAGMVLSINWTIETVLKKTTQTHIYTLDGAGNIYTPSEALYGVSELQ